jgi:hypothetical protein
MNTYNSSKSNLLSPDLRRKIEAVGFLKMVEDRQKRERTETLYDNNQ